MSVSAMFGRMKSLISVAVDEGRSKGKPIALLSGYRRSFRPQKLEAWSQVNSVPSGWSTCKRVSIST